MSERRPRLNFTGMMMSPPSPFAPARIHRATQDTAPDTAPGAAIAADPRWRIVETRDRAADGQFLLGVLTTGIYCRPGCPARTPKPENCRFFESAAEARAAGLRPCLRCKPDGTAPAADTARLIATICARLEAGEEPAPRLHDLAAGVGLSPYHLHRLFKATTGVTPRAWGAAARARRAQAALGAAASVTGALYEAGYASASCFYAETDARLGMVPRAWRDGGAGITLQMAIRPCRLGHVLVAATERGIAQVALGDQPEALEAALRARFPKAQIVAGDAAFAARVAAVIRFVQQPADRAAAAAAAALPVEVRGTAFQERVWQALRAIPPGETRTYAEIAAAIGAPAAHRAVANACGANPVALLTPCHRVVRGDGSNGGYRWGAARKRQLLAAEQTRP